MTESNDKKTRKIVTYPDPMLRAETAPWDPVNNEFHLTADLVRYRDEMLATLRESGGYALAANQVSIPYRIFVTDQGRQEFKESGIPELVINPVISKHPEEKVPVTEGCLSFRGVQLMVPRYPWIDVYYQILAEDGTIVDKHEIVKGTVAQVFQHEIEHLSGKFFLDFLPKSKRVELIMKRK
jgi:peptide deformylase